jgi:hypothetical protein
VVGRKRWVICDPKAAADLYAEHSQSPIDAFHPDLER